MELDLDRLLKDIFEKDAKVLSPLHGGMMNKSFVVESNDKKYVLYIPGPDANEMVNRNIEHYNMSLVYKLGITSKNVYFDEDKGIKVNRYIEGDSLNHVDSFNIEKIAIMLRKLHMGSILTESDYVPFARLKLYEKERSLYQKEVDPYYELIRKLLEKEETYLTNEKLVLSHNDFQRSNIIQDLEDNYWVIDFEFMSNNVELYDVACFGNDNLEDGEKLLYEYKKHSPSKDDYRRFYLWRMFISLQWHNVAITKHFKGEGEIHHIDFLAVANHFLENAKLAYKKFSNYN